MVGQNHGNFYNQYKLFRLSAWNQLEAHEENYYSNWKSVESSTDLWFIHGTAETSWIVKEQVLSLLRIYKLESLKEKIV